MDSSDNHSCKFYWQIFVSEERFAKGVTIGGVPLTKPTWQPSRGYDWAVTGPHQHHNTLL